MPGKWYRLRIELGSDVAAVRFADGPSASVPLVARPLAPFDPKHFTFTLNGPAGGIARVDNFRA